MALSSTAANISTQDGAGAVTNQSNGAVIVMSAGGVMTVALQSTTGVGQWTLEFEAVGYPALHQRKFEWRPGQATSFQIAMPDYPVGGAQDGSPLQGITLLSTVSDSSGGAIPQSTYTVRSVAATGSSLNTLMARALATVALQAYTNVTGTLTENANAAMSTMDGLTLAVGDRFFLPPGIAAAAADVGVYQVTAVGGASAKWSATRVSNMLNGVVIPTGTEVHVTEGALMAGTQWVLTTTGTVTIGTTTQTWFPRQVTQQIVLVAGTVTVANVPILSATKVGMSSVRTTANTSTATTGGYHPVGAITPGNLGTATFAFDATVAAGTINVADVSTLQLTVFNQV